MLVLYIVLLVAGIIVAKIINAIAKHHAVNSGVIGAVFMAPLFLYQIKLIMTTDKLADAPPDKQGEYIGATLGVGLLMLFVAGVIAIQEAKKNDR